ncbi:sn-glycerol-1-phosphate dehydrogenase [Actinomyces wuliandei]|uniref:sn-glycerol-1-phosphate dehydrogenase n=1 Tax=Actinomyces wuliandei TaxID=2057743 RepID=UPI00111A0FC8|nr:sn-glycerol-1-phosphate dehydrogenase [Actinomyces wuliandei]
MEHDQEHEQDGGDLVQQALRDADDTDVVLRGRGVLARTGQVFTGLFGQARGVVVADGNTWEAAGRAVQDSLQQAGVELAEPCVLPAVPTLYADYRNVELLRERLRDLDAVACSVGSGTLNDLAKLASEELGRRYMHVCTAASMDGYAAFGAAITREGFKQTMTCRAPQGLVADLDVIAKAPRRCTASGVGDLIEKVPAGADWILADELGIEPIDQEAWDLAQGSLGRAVGDPEGLVAGRAEAFEGLLEGLVMSGLSMQRYRASSRPASGAGHQFSHTWEMEHLGADQEPPLTHGFKVGLGTVAVLALWERVVGPGSAGSAGSAGDADSAGGMDLGALDVDAAVAAWPSAEQEEARVRASFTGAMVEPAVRQTMAKYVSAEELRQRLELVRRSWPQVRRRCRAQLVAAAEVESLLRRVGGVYHPQQVGLSRQRFRDTYLRSRMIRSRYTLLDLLYQAGVLEAEVDALFSDGGFWAARPWAR